MVSGGPVFARAVGYPHFCRLLTIGVTRHVMACRASIDATEAIELTATEPPGRLLCSACRADLEVRRSRAETVDLRPSVRELGAVAEVEVEEWEG